MQIHSARLRNLAIAIGLAALAVSGLASADPPSRVARLGYMTGEVSFSPAGEDDWARAVMNRPLTLGDRLWADAGARAEIQLGGAMIRMNAGTGVSILNLDDRIVQLQLTQGTLNVRVRRVEPNQVFEVDTPNLAFTLRQPGEYRIVVDADGNATDIVVRRGQGEVYGEGAAYVIDSRQAYRFTGTGLRDYEYLDVPRSDEFDRWSSDRDRGYDNSASARYVSQDVVGYQDLDANGTWRVDATYGNVWIPNRVASDWAPYRDGHWAWVDPWGWTWVDDAPWGFAVSHYGRWTNMRGTWGWVPGPVSTRAYYAPALVAFVGGTNFQIAISTGNVGGVAWFPLGPREVYRPSYAVSRGYFENVNRSNTVINTTVINNYYNNSNVTNVVYANQRVQGAVVAVPTATFVQSQPVQRAAVRVSPAMVASAPVAAVAAVAPTERSVRGAGAAGDKPPPRVFQRTAVARTVPPAATASFASQQQQLAAKPGKPLDDAARREIKTAAPVAAPAVKVVTPTQTAQPTARPPAATRTARPSDAPGKSDDRKAPEAASPTAAAPAAQPPETRGRPPQPGNAEKRGQPGAPPVVASPQVVPPVVAPPQVAPPVVASPSPGAPAAQPPGTRGRPPQPGNADQRAQPVAPPVVAPPPQVAQPQETRGRPAQPGNAQQRGQPVAPPVAAPPPQVAPPVVAAPAPETRGRPAQPGNAERRGPPVAPPAVTAAPSQRTAEPQVVAPPSPAPAPVVRPMPQRVPPPESAPPRQAAPPPVAQVAKPEPVPAARAPQPQPQSRPPAAAPNAPPPPQAQAQTNAPPRGQGSRPASDKPDDKKKDADEQKRDDEARKPKG
jgi:hypothetical protein